MSFYKQLQKSGNFEQFVKSSACIIQMVSSWILGGHSSWLRLLPKLHLFVIFYGMLWNPAPPQCVPSMTQKFMLNYKFKKASHDALHNRNMSKKNFRHDIQKPHWVIVRSPITDKIPCNVEISKYGWKNRKLIEKLLSTKWISQFHCWFFRPSREGTKCSPCRHMWCWCWCWHKYGVDIIHN